MDPTSAAIGLIEALVGGGIYGGLGWVYAKRQGEASSIVKLLTTILTAIFIVLIAQTMNLGFNDATQVFISMGGAAVVSKIIAWLKFEMGWTKDDEKTDPPLPPPPTDAPTDAPADATKPRIPSGMS